MMTKTLPFLATLLLVVGCARGDLAGLASADATGTAAGAGQGAAAASMASPGGPAARAPGTSRVASLPDRGELASYPGDLVRVQGAYTWHRADISEAHLLQAVASGHLRLTTPDGRRLDFRYDHHVEHASGDWTWIGELAGSRGAQAVLTIGADAVFGTIAQGEGLPLRLTMRDGLSWLVETDAAKLADNTSAAAKPKHPDYRIVAESMLPRRAAGARPAAAAPPQAASIPPVSGPITDMLVGYTPGFRDAYSGASGALTRINYLVDLTNTAYANGGIAGRLRLVHAMEVDYTDTTSNTDALESLSGYESGTGPVTPGAEFTALRQARETYGADLVSLVRDFRDPEHEGCGIAWLLGGGLQGIGANEGWDELGYSVVSDGIDKNEEDGKNYFCRDETFAHEVGHNMGAAHDVETSKGDDGTLDNPDDYGAYTYSFGYKPTGVGGNFFTIMAYGDSGQTSYATFSTPDTTFCGGNPCGTASADNVRTLNNTMPAISGFRATIVPDGSRVRQDFDGDGMSDILWRNTVDGRNTVWHSGTQADRESLVAITDTRWQAVAVGDFNGDGEADIFWRHAANGKNTLWFSGDQATRQSLNAITDLKWQVVGAGDFNADGEDDILWRNSGSGRNTIWYSGTQANREPITEVTDVRYQVVGIGDFDGDGKSDIFWRHSSTGKNIVWYSANRNSRASLRTVSDTDYRVVGTGDFDGDGRDDVLWRNIDSGKNTIWKGADGSDKQAVTSVTGNGWRVAGTGDYDGDGVADIYWRDTVHGDNVLWPGADRGQRDVQQSIDIEWAIVP